MLENEIALCCKTLKLGSSIVESSQRIEAKTPQEYLHKIFLEEISRRKAARRTRYMNKAGFYSVKTFEGYQFDQIKIPSALSPEELISGDFIGRKENLILYGNVGTGKTHMATAIGVKACQAGKEVKFFRTATLVDYLIEQKAKGDIAKALKAINKAELLILDEWGYIPLDRDGARLLFQVISDCYEKRSIILTTNLEFNKWITMLYDELMTSAIIDRIVHHGHLIVFDGASKRLGEALMNQ